MSSGNDGISWHVLLPSFCSGPILLSGLLGVGFRRSVSIWLPGKEVLKKRGGEPGMRGGCDHGLETLYNLSMGGSFQVKHGILIKCPDLVWLWCL